MNKQNDLKQLEKDRKKKQRDESKRGLMSSSILQTCHSKCCGEKNVRSNLCWKQHRFCKCSNSYFVLHAGFIPAKQETLLHMDEKILVPSPQKAPQDRVLHSSGGCFASHWRSLTCRIPTSLCQYSVRTSQSQRRRKNLFFRGLGLGLEKLIKCFLRKIQQRMTLLSKLFFPMECSK